MKNEKNVISLDATILVDGKPYLTVPQYCKKYKMNQRALWYHIGKHVPKTHLAGTKTVILPDEPVVMKHNKVRL